VSNRLVGDFVLTQNNIGNNDYPKSFLIFSLVLKQLLKKSVGQQECRVFPYDCQQIQDQVTVKSFLFL
jgi:hypothetical protein